MVHFVCLFGAYVCWSHLKNIFGRSAVAFNKVSFVSQKFAFIVDYLLQVRSSSSTNSSARLYLVNKPYSVVSIVAYTLKKGILQD